MGKFYGMWLYLNKVFKTKRGWSTKVITGKSSGGSSQIIWTIFNLGGDSPVYLKENCIWISIYMSAYDDFMCVYI